METLKEKVKGLRQENPSDRSFIPEAAFFKLMTRQEVEGAINASEIKSYHRQELIELVFARGRKVFAILLLNDSLGLLPKFREAGILEDARLPFDRDTLKQKLLLNNTQFVRKELKTNGSHERELEVLAILSTIKHPNIIQLLGSYTYDKKYHNLLFPCAEHGSLKKFISEDKQSMSDKTIIIALAGLASAIKHLHRFTDDKLKLDLIGCHHDLKPDNILVSSKTLLLADFGLSKLKESNIGSETPFRPRTDDYVAPECEDWDNDYLPGYVHRYSDIWSLGCIFAEVATYVLRGHQGVKDFRDARMHKRPGATHFSFHLGANKASDAVLAWLANLEQSSQTGIALLIQLSRKMISLDASARPTASDVEQCLRMIALFEVSAQIHNQFNHIQRASHSRLDYYLESVRFKAWTDTTRLASIATISDLLSETYESINKLFDTILGTLTRMQHQLESALALASSRPMTNADILNVADLNDELALLLGDKENDSRERVKIIIFKDEVELSDLSEPGDGLDGLSLPDNIRMRSNIKNMRKFYEEDSFIDTKGLRIEPTKVGGLRSIGDHYLGNMKTDIVSEKVWVELRHYGRHGTDKNTMEHLYERTVRLCALLALPEFCALKCKGLVHLYDKQAFGIVFEFPQKVKGGGIPFDPINLQTLLKKKGESTDSYFPDLDDRFKLAYTLAAALFEFHTLGWLHRNLSPLNLIFLPENDGTPTTQLIRSPWLVGFGHSRPNSPVDFTSGAPDSASGRYQHPVYMDEKKGYRAEYDYYSLGMILLEIGYWKPLEKLTEGWQGSYEERRQKLLRNKGKVAHLSKMMGRQYTEVVRFCLGYDVQSEKSVGDVVSQFYQSVVAPLRGLSQLTKP
ncbi:unnamed protein product [Clonostachys byssicola]|uniref:Protein kinase domain-containing protein n=1 Tax=Clonostachys byssicola TaxID=160290 RepID=A0A9N9UTK3_9HYPO|nr:unnamed protein product [Clonostachys byssicola]